MKPGISPVVEKGGTNDNPDPSPGTSDPATLQAVAGCSEETTPVALDIALSKFKTQISRLCDAIMRAAIAYVDARLCIQTASRMKALYENNRPQPHWWDEPRAQELLLSIANLKAMEEHLQGVKDFIRKQKDVLIRVYEQMQQVYNEQQNYSTSSGVGGKVERKEMCSVHKAKVAELMRDMNIKVVHVMTSMELVMVADNRSDAAIDLTVVRQFGEPTPAP